MSDGVMIANFIWKSAKSASGMVGAIASFTFAPTSRNMKNCAGLPMSPSPPTSSPKLSEKPTTTQRMEMMPMAMKLWRIVEITFLRPTMPP